VVVADAIAAVSLIRISSNVVVENGAGALASLERKF
jgi:hypothetical protein